MTQAAQRTRQCVVHQRPPKQHGWVRVEAHALAHTAHAVAQLGVVLQGGLGAGTHHSVNLFLSLCFFGMCVCVPGGVFRVLHS